MNLAADKFVVIVNYGMGNLHSLQNALTYLGVKSLITSDPRLVNDADVLMLPGVGSFRSAINNLKAKGLDEAILQAVKKRKVPLLGICLGMQLLADEGEEEGLTKGLGLISGKVITFSSMELRLPHIGFNAVKQHNSDSCLFEGVEDGSDFYFVHSYHFKCASPQNIIGITNYNQDFVSAVQSGNVYGVQFHPEKSQSNGLRLLSNFIKNHL